ncbi:MAG: hypothetical protein HY881_03775 [Deltaproteobacteria bacterium]|nr:hypothetical protein [Deltaproteobacteria bacterium]
MKNTTMHPLRCMAAIPHIIVILWLIYLGNMIWQHDVQSVQPPHHDPLTYMQKAMNFWKAVDQGILFNPLNIEPTSRPPGTILMSYPFGFSSDFKGFHFRSVFVPIICIVLAVYMAAGIPRTSAEGWGVAAVAILFSSVPIFFNFDYTDGYTGPSAWGLVDNFQAGFAAMAAAGFVKSLKVRSLVWLMWGAFVGSFTLLIKPSGLMIMALLSATWLIVVFVEWLWARRYQQSNSNLRRYVIIGGIQIFLIYAVVVLLCVFSNYFSIQNFEYAKHALKVMGDVLTASLSQILVLLIASAGIPFVLWVLWKVVLIISYCFSRNNRHNPLSAKMVGLLLSTPVIWSMGVWYWLVVQAGGSQVRYFYPFFLMGAVCMIPMSLHVLQHSHRWIRLAELVFCFLPALNIGSLLALESPPIQWQMLSGVNVSVGKDREEVNQAYTFLDELRKRKMSANLYSFFSGTLPDIFVTVGIYEGMVKPDLPFFKTISTVDWVRGFIVRTDQLLNVDYILIRKDLIRKAEKLLDRQIDTYISEYVVFQAWLCGLNENAGVKTVSDGRVLRLLEIIDRKAFAYALESFVAAHSWRPEFIAANSQRQWSNEADVSGYAGNFAAKEIDFEGIYRLHALSLCRVDTGLKVELWWEELRHENANGQRRMFFHIVDQSGKMLQDLYMPLDKYAPPFDNRRWCYGSVTFEQPIPNEVTSLAFGIFRPKNEFLNDDFLMPDKGVHDWGGRRVLVPISVSTS